jgi:hypothetical protein
MPTRTVNAMALGLRMLGAKATGLRMFICGEMRAVIDTVIGIAIPHIQIPLSTHPHEVGPGQRGDECAWRQDNPVDGHRRLLAEFVGEEKGPQRAELLISYYSH